MATRKKIKITNESSTFGDIVTDMHLRKKNVPDRDIEAELFKTNHQAEIIDAFEKRIGIQRKSTKAPNIQVKAKLFNLSYAADLALYNKLLNDPKYHIVKSDSTFNEDEYLAFIHYTDNLDMKEKESPTNE